MVLHYLLEQGVLRCRLFLHCCRPQFNRIARLFNRTSVGPLVSPQRLLALEEADEAQMLDRFLSKLVSGDLVEPNQLIEVFLSMRPRLCARPCSDIFVHFVPVLAIKSQRLNELVMFTVGPAAVVGGWLVARVVAFGLLFGGIVVQARVAVLVKRYTCLSLVYIKRPRWHTLAF